ncbi:FliM/FliN family flagellar motor switch protein [Lelliottia sp. WAP21]|uniref:FliM/FliN family flagellar motor switch protein n=1 Tax=Lelliottia sp. WAP21 TaxID=2877426 RepID=UPI001E5971BF|nr:FliM/FliN family flagellar motor switch protein [Lelliottia sp. WAP21]
MSLRRHLRKRYEDQQKLLQLHNRLPGSEISHPARDARYLPLRLRNENNDQAKAWFDVDAWLRQMNLHLPAIPWTEVPVDYLANWLARLGLNFYFAETVWSVEAITPAVTELPPAALLLHANPCSLWCLDWPEDPLERHRTPGIPAWLIPFPLQFSLGYSRLSLSQLMDVASGDLLLIKRPEAYLTVGARRIYRVSYTHNQEVIVQEQYVEYEDEYRDEDETLYEWASLPVEMEFVLDGSRVTLDELEDIRPGSALSLPHDAEKNMKIYLNKKLFARGELVALENGALAVEVNHVNTGLIGNMGTSDVE